MTLKLVQPEKTAKSSRRPLPPARRRNDSVRAREYLTADEIRRVREAARKIGRNGFRDALLITVAFRHGLRVAELVGLTWDQVHFEDGTLLVKRVKNGRPGTHYLEGEELRQLRRLQRENQGCRFVFCSERGGPLTTRTVRHIVARAGCGAGLPFPIHPHMLRHARGYLLAQKGTDTRTIQGYLGHADIKSTVVYTDLAATRFAGLEGD